VPSRTRLNAALSPILARNRKRERSDSNNATEKAYDIQYETTTAGAYYVLHAFGSVDRYTRHASQFS